MVENSNRSLFIVSSLCLNGVTNRELFNSYGIEYSGNMWTAAPTNRVGQYVASSEPFI